MIFCPQCNACPDFVFKDGKDCLVCPDCQTTSEIPDLTVIHKKASTHWSPTPTNAACGIYPMIRNFACKTKDCCGEGVVVRNGFVVDYICSQCGKSDKVATNNKSDMADTPDTPDSTTPDESSAEPSPEPPKKSRTTKKKSKTD
jgi:hypothetical protein